jgi:thiol-disulfide isomerase/thioredoxin
LSRSSRTASKAFRKSDELSAGRDRAAGASFQTFFNNRVTRFLLYSRSWCHLCEDMLAALMPYAQDKQVDIEVVDIDADETLVAQYDELIPVLFGLRDGEAPRQLCHYFLDPAAVSALLAPG